MKILTSRDFSRGDLVNKLREKRSKQADVETTVADILKNVRLEGDQALYRYSQKFDRTELKNLLVSAKEIKEAYGQVDKKLLQAVKKARRNITLFHTQQIRKQERKIQTVPGVSVWREFRPVEKVGLYVPGGRAPLVSTVLMLAIPAQLAGCPEIILCTPPSPEGKIHPAILVAADICGVKKIFTVGGAQAIAGMAYGTETIPKVYKIVGPGNQYVTTAKMLVYGEVDIDMPAGPSEVLVLADETARPDWVAADLLSQLEHGPDSQSVLVTFSKAFAEKVVALMQEQVKKLSRQEIILQSLQKSFALVVRSPEEAISVINEYGPEHLEIVIKNPETIARKIMNVGSIFLGPYASEPLGDYATGSNHTLPTSGYAKMFSALSVDTFGKMIQLQSVSKKGIANLKETVETLATAEGLDAHGNAVTIRFSS